MTRYALYDNYDHYKREVFPKLLQDPDVPASDKKIITELLSKPWNPYIQRHNALTEISKLVKESVLRVHANWSPNSKMPEIYLHHFGNASTESLLEAHGITTKDQQIDKLRPKQCPNCNEPNKPDSKFCAKCRMVLTYDAYNETVVQQHEKENQVQALIKKQERFEQFIQSLVDSGQLTPTSK